MTPRDLRRSLELWSDWCLAEARDPDWLSVEAGEAYLASLFDGRTSPGSAGSRFATFQIAAGHAWGPEASSHLAPTLRAARVTDKAAPADRWVRAAGSVAALPPSARPSFEALLARSRDTPGARGGKLVWSAARIEAVAAAVRRFHAFADSGAAEPLPGAAVFRAWAEEIRTGGAAATSVASYLSRVIDGFERILTPGLLYDAAAAVADRWAAAAKSEPPRKGKASRIVPASDVDALGFDLMARADAAPLRRIGEATMYRDGLMLAVAATVPERARAVSAMSLGETVFLEPGGVIRFAIPGEHLKGPEAAKKRRAFHARIHRPSLHRALTRWRAVYRPMFDDGAWLWPSRLNRNHGLSEKAIGKKVGDVTEAAFGRRVSLHMVRDCVATEIVEDDPMDGATLATGVLRHRSAEVSEDFYIHSRGLAASAGWRDVVEKRVGNLRQNLVT